MHFTFTMFFLVHLVNFIFGSVVIFPMGYDLYWYQKDQDFLMNALLCYPDIFWFSLLTLLMEYLILVIFSIMFLSIVRDMK